MIEEGKMTVISIFVTWIGNVPEFPKLSGQDKLGSFELIYEINMVNISSTDAIEG